MNKEEEVKVRDYLLIIGVSSTILSFFFGLVMWVIEIQLKLTLFTLKWYWQVFFGSLVFLAVIGVIFVSEYLVIGLRLTMDDIKLRKQLYLIDKKNRIEKAKLSIAEKRAKKLLPKKESKPIDSNTTHYKEKDPV